MIRKFLKFYELHVRFIHKMSEASVSIGSQEISTSNKNDDSTTMDVGSKPSLSLVTGDSPSSKDKKKRKRNRAHKHGTHDDNSKDNQDDKSRPNSFLSIPITNAEIQGNISKIQNFIVERDANLKSLMITLPTLHLTLGVFSLKETPEEIESAKLALLESKQRILNDGATFPMSVSIKGLGSFNDNVLYAKVVPSDNLKVIADMAETLTYKMEEKGLELADSRPFQPHITIMKLSRGKYSLKKNLKKIIPEIESKYKDEILGDDTVDRVDLCWMQKQRATNGYYEIIHHIKFIEDDSNLTTNCDSKDDVDMTNVTEADEQIVSDKNINTKEDKTF